MRPVALLAALAALAGCESAVNHCIPARPEHYCGEYGKGHNPKEDRTECESRGGTFKKGPCPTADVVGRCAHRSDSATPWIYKETYYKGFANQDFSQPQALAEMKAACETGRGGTFEKP